MAKQKPDSAAGASSTGAPAAVSSKAATDLTAACEQLLSGSHHLDSAALRDALLDLHEFWLSDEGRRDRNHRNQRLRHRRHRRSRPPGAAAVLRSRPDAAARQPARRSRQRGGREPVVPVVGRQHSARPQRAYRCRGAEGRRRGHLGGSGDAGGAPHRGRRRSVVAVGRWCPSPVAHRNRLALRRTRRTHPAAVAAQRPDRPPCRAGPQDAAAVVCATCSCSTRWRSPNWPTSTPAGRWPRRPKHSARRTSPCSTFAPSCTGCPGRGRELLLAQHADEIGAALRIGDRFDLARMLSDAARTVSFYVDAGLRTAANALPRRGLAAFRRPVRRPLDEGVIEFARRGHPGPRRPPGARPRTDPAGGRRLGDHRPADGGVHAWRGSAKPRPNCARRGRRRRSRTCW